MPKQVDILEQDLNSVISNAVQARIEAQVMAALSGDEVFAQFVSSALSSEIVVRDKDFRERRTTYLAETIRKALQEATQGAVEKVMVEIAPELEAEVAKELRRSVKGLASHLVGSVQDAVKAPYGFKVELKGPNNG